MAFLQQKPNWTGDERHRTDPLKKLAVCIIDDLDNGEFLMPLSDVPSIPWIPHKKGSRPLCTTTIYKWCDASKRKGRILESTDGTCRCTTNGALRRFFGLGGNRPVDLGQNMDRLPA